MLSYLVSFDEKRLFFKDGPGLSNPNSASEEASFGSRIIKVLGTLLPAPKINKRFSSLTPFLTEVLHRKGAFFILVMAFVAMLGAVSAAEAQTVTPPGKPTNLSVLNDDMASTKRFSLTWTAPTDNGGSAITGYKIEWSTALFGNEFHPWFVLEENTMSGTMNYTHDHDIAPGIKMQFRVSAINSAGTGLPSHSDTGEMVTTAHPNMDTTPPMQLDDMITVNGTRIEVKFTEDLDTDEIPPIVHFAAHINSDIGTIRPRSVEIDTADNSKLIITLKDSDALEISDNLVARYFPPRIVMGGVVEIPVSDKSLQDVNGNVVRSFYQQARNETPFCPKLVLRPERIRENQTSTVTATFMPASLEDLTLTVMAEAASPQAPTDPAYFELEGAELEIAANATESTGAVRITAGDNDEVGEEDKMVTVSATVMKQTNSMIETCSSVAPVTLAIRDDDRPVRITRLVNPPVGSSDGSPAGDRESLEAVYNATGGDDWTRATNWNTDEPLNTWYGVETGSDGQVTGLILNDNGLEGRVPAELGDLTNLRRLYLNDNRLSGAIPLEELEALAANSALEELALWGNDQLTGLESVSAELGKRIDRAALRALYENNGGSEWREKENWLDPNELFSFSNWDGVETNDNGRVSELDLSGNGLKGDITNAIEALGGLETLDLSGNADLSGELGLGLVSLSELDALYIQDTGVCAPETAGLEQWLAGISFDGRSCVTDLEVGTGLGDGSGCSVVSDGRTVNALADTMLNLLLIVSALFAILLKSRSKAMWLTP